MINGGVSPAPEERETAYGMPERKVRVLFFSSIVLTPATGGGNTIFNLFEPCPPGGEVFYVSPSIYPPESAPFPELSSRIYEFSNSNVPAALRGGWLSRVLRSRFSNVIDQMKTRARREPIFKQIVQYIKQLQIDVLFVCPETNLDLRVASELVEKIGLPTVTWFMDNHYIDKSSILDARKLWDNSQHRFVLNESMKEYFSDQFGGDCEVLNNVVDFPESYVEPPTTSDPRLRVAYAGAMTSYYLDCVLKMLEDIRGLADQVLFDIYSPNALPPEFEPNEDDPWRKLPPVEPGHIIQCLQEYDVLFLVSSFKPEHRLLAEMAQSSKIADYMAAGRCILVYGPEYAENVRYVLRHGIGEVVTSQAPTSLSKVVLSLAHQSERRKELGKHAYFFGREHRDKKRNSDRLWQAIFRVHNSSAG